MHSLCRTIEACCDRSLVLLASQAAEPVVLGREYRVKVRFSGVEDLVCECFGSRLMLDTVFIFDRIAPSIAPLEDGLCEVDLQLLVQTAIASLKNTPASERRFMQVRYTCKGCRLVPTMLVGMPWVQLRSDNAPRMRVQGGLRRDMALVPSTIRLDGFSGVMFKDPVLVRILSLLRPTLSQPILMDLSEEWEPFSALGMLSTPAVGVKQIRCTERFSEFLGIAIQAGLTIEFHTDGFSTLMVGSHTHTSFYPTDDYIRSCMSLCRIELDVELPDCVVMTFDDGGRTKVVFVLTKFDDI